MTVKVFQSRDPDICVDNFGARQENSTRPSIDRQMSASGLNFQKTWLWRQAFEGSRSDCTKEEQDFFKVQYLSIREKAAQLVAEIPKDLPGLTVHDLSHLDALWEITSLVAEDAVQINPVEAFVLGAGILLHDAAMSLAAYPRGLADIRETIVWRDTVASIALSMKERGDDTIDVNSPPSDVMNQAVPSVLRRLHAEQAEKLAEQAWQTQEGEAIYLIENFNLRKFYGPTIGQIAHSHWWPLHRVENELSENLGALAGQTNFTVDRVKLACLLRVADALHLDSRRAPRFLRAITNPRGESSLHWAFQERISLPRIEFDTIVFTTGQPFGRTDADAWWLAYDTINAVDRELRDVNSLLQSRGRMVLNARGVKGAGSPEVLSQTLQTRDWRPVDTRFLVSDVPRIVEDLGGSKLYGDNPSVALRELLQNAADAIQARRKMQNRPDNWGKITISLSKRENDYWLVVEDNGIGMSERVLTGPLLDFGASFWRSTMAMEEFPGLMASGMHAAGRFGIGFFSVFMLGRLVRVYSCRCDQGRATGRLLEFCDGTSSRPILSPADTEEVPIDGGTRVEVLLEKNPYQSGGLLSAKSFPRASISLSSLVGAVAPNLDVAVSAVTGETILPIICPDDWLRITELDLFKRLHPHLSDNECDKCKIDYLLMRPIIGSDNVVYGRASIKPSIRLFREDSGWITVSGLRAHQLDNVQGILLGEAITAVRDSARPLVPKEVLGQWATEQAELICKLVRDEARQARSAEVVLECGGDIGALKIIKWGPEWLDTKEFEQRLRSLEEVAIGFDDEFGYEEDIDEVHPQDFRENFVQSTDVAVIPNHRGRIIRSDNFRWPKEHADHPRSSNSNIFRFIRDRIFHVWGPDVEKDGEERTVGRVGYTEIIRGVTVFYSSRQ